MVFYWLLVAMLFDSSYVASIPFSVQRAQYCSYWPFFRIKCNVSELMLWKSSDMQPSLFAALFLMTIFCRIEKWRFWQVRGLYRGATSSFIGVSFESSLLFGIYSRTKQSLQVCTEEIEAFLLIRIFGPFASTLNVCQNISTLSSTILEFLAHKDCVA